MKYFTFEINNYKNIKKVEVRILSKKINYILGCNESGKSNLIQSLQYFSENRRELKIYLDDKKDLTQLNGLPIKGEKISFYLKNLENHKIKIDNELNVIPPKEVVKPILPYVYINNPILESVQNVELSMMLSDLHINNNNPNLAKAVFKAFETPKLKESLNTVIDNFNKDIDDSAKSSMRLKLNEELNKKIKKYFNSINHIQAYPKFNLNNDRFTMSIESSKKYKIDTKNINDRSTGFKCLYKILIEAKSYAAISDKDTPIIYVIDEPEQGLHPFLQTELLKNLKNIINSQNKANNFTLIIVTHSPFMLENSYRDLKQSEYCSNINYISRDGDGYLNLESFNDVDVISKYWYKYKMNLKDNKFNEELYYQKILFDGFSLSKLRDLINPLRVELNLKLCKGEISQSEFESKLKNIDLLVLGEKNET